MKYQNPSHYKYRTLGTIDAIKREKYRLNCSITQQERILSEDWEQIKNPFRFANMAINIGKLFFSSEKKPDWWSAIISGCRYAVKLVR